MAFVDAEALPDLDGLVVVKEHGEVEFLFRKAQNLGGELHCPGAHLLLEVLAEAEVAQHLEEAQVTAVGADDVDVVGAHALLNGGGADVVGVELLHMQEVRLELHHAGAGKKQRRVVGNKGRRRQALAPLAFEEAEVLLADLSRSHVLHVLNPRYLLFAHVLDLPVHSIP